MENSLTFETVKIVFYSALILLLIYLLGLYLRRLPLLQPMGKRIKVLEKVSLGQRQGLYLIRVDNRDLLVGVTEGGLKLLSELKYPEGDGDNGEQD